MDRILEDAKHFDIETIAELNANAKLEYVLGNKDFEYFHKLGISEKTLKKYGVHTARAIYVEEDLYWRSTEKNPIFVYQFPSGTFKVYRPLSKDSTKKWKSNCTIKDIQGYYQLPTSSKLLIITSSMKDVMVLRELGYNAIAFNSEGIPTKGENGKFVAETIEHLKERFDNVVLFLDNDAAGKAYSIKLSKHYGIPYILIPDNEPKDISDYLSKYGRRKTKRMFNKQLKKILIHDLAREFDQMVSNSSLNSLHSIDNTKTSEN